MVKSVLLNDNTHLLLVKKQSEFLGNGIKKSLPEVADVAINKGLDEIKLSEIQKIEIEKLKNEIEELNMNKITDINKIWDKNDGTL